MLLLKKLWADDAGAVLSAEAAIIGTVAVAGVGAGMNVVASSVNEELRDVAHAIRSLDQSYTIPCRKACGAWTAGSQFTQAPVEESLEELDRLEQREEARARKKARRLKKRVERQKERRKQRQNSPPEDRGPSEDPETI